MIKAIVYTSNTGTTKDYAEVLGRRLSLPVYRLEKVKEEISKEDEIIYMGWLSASSIKGFEKARKKYNVKVVCAVGIASAGSQDDAILKRNRINKEKFFYLLGRFDINKLHGLDKFLMKMMISILTSMIKNKTKKGEAVPEAKMLEEISAGVDNFNEENLNPVIDWVRSQV